MKYIKGLDGIRAVSIIMVIFFHFHNLLGFGWIGVQVFFVLSGYLITGILIEMKGLSLGHYFKRFYWRRSLRIFPLYFSILLLVAFIYFIWKSPSGYMSIFPFLMTYTYNFEPLFHGLSFDSLFVHFWSLSVEEQFYMVWPLVVYFTNNRQLRIVLIFIIILSPIARFTTGVLLSNNDFYIQDSVGELIYRITFCQFDAFAFGALIPVFNLKHLKLERYLIYVFMIFLLLGVYIAYLSNANIETIVRTLGYNLGAMDYYQHVWSYSLIGLLSMLFVLYTINSKGGWINKIFLFAPMVYIGKISYGLYVFHWPVLKIVNAYLIKPKYVDLWSGMLIYILVSIGIAALSFHYFESLFLNLKDKKFGMKKVNVSN